MKTCSKPVCRSFLAVLVALFLGGAAEPGCAPQETNDASADGGSESLGSMDSGVRKKPVPTDGGASGSDTGTAPADGDTGADAGTPPPADGEPTPGTDPGTGSPGGLVPRLPAATGVCPTFASGLLTFAPQGIKARGVRIWMNPSAAASLDGPLVFYWHGTGSSPTEAVTGLSQTVIDRITAAGGIVAAPSADPEAGTFPWFLTAALGTARLDDLLVADEVLACAARQVGIDTRRIHSIGMSAGGLQTAQMSYRRSSYLASVATYSGGLASSIAPAYADATNLFAALIFHGGPSDVIFMGFQQASETYWSKLDAKGHFAAICNHGRGHTIPTDARESVWAFFQAHPYRQSPSPYLSGLPAGFPSYCSLAP